MTDSAMRAKLWLTRTDGLTEEIEADYQVLEKMKNRVNAAVSKYENDGSNNRDVEAAKARHEDALLDYSSQLAKIKGKELALNQELQKTEEVINMIVYVKGGENLGATYRAIAKRRYIVGEKWFLIANKVHRSESQVYKDNLVILEIVSDILARHFII